MPEKAREIRRRIASVKNTKKITRTMEVWARNMQEGLNRLPRFAWEQDPTGLIWWAIVLGDGSRGVENGVEVIDVGGGYVLARPAEEIRLSEIVSAVDGPITLGDFGEPHQDGACDHEGQCVLLGIWNKAGEHMRTYLEGFTLAGIADIARGDAPWP